MTFLKMERHLLPIKAHYFLYFGGMGPLYPFIPIIIRNMGFSDTIVGVIFLWLPICGMVAKTWFGALADKYKKQRFFFLLFIFLSLAFAFCILLLPSSSKKPSVTLECASTGTNFHFCSASQLPENEKQQFLSQNLTNIPCHLICQNNDKASFSLADELCKSWGVPDFCNSQELRGIGEDYNLLSNEARPKSSNNLKSFRFEFSTFVSTNSSHAMQGCMYFPLGRAVFRNTQTESLHCSQAQTIICDMNCENGALKELWIQSMSRTKINDNDAFTMPLFWLLFVTLICVQSSVAVVVIMGDAICFQLLGDKPEGFGGQRLWASVGWGILSILSGHLVDLLNEGKEHRNYDILIYLSIGMFALDFFAAYNIKCTQTNVSMNIFKDLTKLLSQFRIVVFVAWCIVTGIFSALLWNFLFLYIEDLAAEQGSGNTQWTKTLTGLIIGVQSLGGEVPFFFLSESILKKLGHIHTMSVVLASFILRFSLISLVINPWYILPIELLNGVTYGLLTSAMNSYASIVAPPGTEATTQGLVGAIFEGIGTSIGSYICGNLFDFYGGRTVFRIFSVAAAGAFVFHVIIQYAIQLKVRLKSGKNLGKPDTNGVKNETLQMQ